MATGVLSDRAIIGRFFERLQQDPAMQIVNKLAFINTDSDQETETYKWLGQAPAMREWVGGRQEKGLNDFAYAITNKEFEASVQFKSKDFRRDKTGQILARIDDMAARAAAHPWKLIADLIYSGNSTVCYDGQFFFDTDHSEGDSGTQDNDITVDISGLPIAGSNAGTITAPSDEAMAAAIFKAITQMMGFLDDQGEPVNENAREFLVVCPPSLMSSAMSAVTDKNLTGGKTNTLASSGFNLEVMASPRLAPAASPWTDEIAVFRTDAPMKPFILQEEKPLEMRILGEGSDLYVKEDKLFYGVDVTRNAGYGLWQYGCLVTLI